MSGNTTLDNKNTKEIIKQLLSSTLDETTRKSLEEEFLTYVKEEYKDFSFIVNTGRVKCNIILLITLKLLVKSTLEVRNICKSNIITVDQDGYTTWSQENGK